MKRRGFTGLMSTLNQKIAQIQATGVPNTNAPTNAPTVPTNAPTKPSP
jgi:hypothetical protein